MKYKNNKKRLYFSTGDNPAEDSFAFRKAKTARLRNVIRTCFYLHCAAAVACIALSVILSAGFDIVKISVCAVTSVVFAFFAVGELEHVKAISCVIDFTFAAGAFISVALGQNKLLFLVSGILMTILGISMIVSAIAAARKRALDNPSAFSQRRDGHPQQNSFSAYPDYDDIPDLPEDYVVETPVNVQTAPSTPTPRPYENMRKLAAQVSEILCAEPDKNDN